MVRLKTNCILTQVVKCDVDGLKNDFQNVHVLKPGMFDESEGSSLKFFSNIRDEDLSEY